MEFNLFLWPMLIPIIIPLVYSVKYNKDALRDIITVLITMSLIVVLFWPLLTSNFLGDYTYLVVKILLFILLPILMFVLGRQDLSFVRPSTYGIQQEGLAKSILLCLLFVPLMLIVTGALYYVLVLSNEAHTLAGIISFFDAFTEEFFFRGILFFFLLKKTNLPVAYATSLASFVLMHPQHIPSLFIISTIVQGVLTIEIVRRSENITGAWLLHGINRVFTLALLPLFLII